MFRGLVGPEDCVYSSKKVVEPLRPLLGDDLSGQDKIVQVDVYLVQGVRLLF